MPIIPTIPIIDKLTYPVKKLLGFAAKNSMQAQDKSGKEIIQDLVKRDEPSFYLEQTRDGGNEIDTYLYGTPYNTENTSNIGPSYENYLSAKFPLRKHAVKTYDTHFGDTLYIDQKYKDQVLDELEQGKTVGASMGRYAHAPSYIVNTKDDERRPYDAGGHLMQFQYDKDGNVIANMSDIYDFLPRDFEEKYGAIKEYGPLKTVGIYAMHYAGTPFIVRQNGIPVRFKEIVPEYKTELQSKLGNFLSEWGDMFDLTIPHRLTDEQIKEIFNGRGNGDEILDFMDQKGYLTPSFKKGGRIHIKKKNRGKFTESAKRAGMGVQEYARHILANKDKYSSTLVKRANFARNSKKFKHEDGGILKYQNPSETLPELIQRINKKSKANFVKRLLDPNRKSIQDWVAPLNIATHKLGWATEDTKQGAFVYPEVQEINGELIDFTHPSHRRSEGINSAIERRDTVRMTPEQAKWFTENYKQYYPGFKDGGILKAQDGTEGLLTPHPLSPVGIALNQAKAIAKMKEKQHLPPGVKEVVGPDGKKVVIRTEQPLVPLEQSIAEWLPGTGDVAEVGYIANDVKNGNYGTAALAAGLMVLPGNARKILDKFGVDLGDISTFKRLSDQEWDDMYFQAIDSGDMDLVQTIRDAHFKVKAAGASVDADGNLIKTYRGQYPKQKYKEHDLNPFSDKRDDNRSSGYFSSTSSQIADTYVQPGGDKFELYTNFTNPSVVDAKGKGYKTAVSQVEPDGRVVGIQTDAYVNKAFGQGYDGVIIKNVKDASVGNNLNDLEKIADDYVGAAGRSKLADPITRELDIFTGDYEIIPISRRDNFNMSDIRYGIVPLFLGLGAAKAVSNSGNTKEQQ